MTTQDLSVIIAWISKIITADEAAEALGIHRSELREWEMDAIDAGRRIVAALPETERVTGDGRSETRA